MGNPSTRIKADREAMAAQFAEIAARHGATIERTDAARDITLSARMPCGSSASVWLRPAESESHLLSWVARGKAGTVFCGAFNVATDANLVNAPHHKASTITDDWEHLLGCLDEGLALIAAGEAFTHYVHPWAADTAWVAVGSPEPREPWIEHYRATGEALSIHPRIAAARQAFRDAGGDDNWQEATRAAAAAMETLPC